MIFGPKGRPHLIIAGSRFPVTAITFRRRSLGARSGFPRVPFTLEVDAADVRKRFRPFVDQMQEQLIADDQTTGQFDPAYDGATSHPDFTAFMALPETARLQITNVYLAEDLFGLYLREESPSRACRYLAVNDALTGFARHGNRIRITGEAVPLSGP
jgi:hypothetical protein